MTEPTPEMIDAALNAWFKSPPSETDQGLERSMKATLIASERLRGAAQQPLNREAVANAIINNMPRLNGLNAAVDAIMALALPSTHQREDDELSEWKQAASVEAGLRREFMAQVDAAREFVKRHPALTLIDLAEFEAFLKVPAAVDAALSSTNLGSHATGTPSREPTGEYTITPADRSGGAQ